jgi:hypothetical protein
MPRHRPPASFSSVAIQFALVMSVASLSACGGGGGSAGVATTAPATPSAPAPPAPAVCNGVQMTADAQVDAGKTAAATILACTGTLADINWTQVSGPAVTLLSARSPTVAVETSTPGVIRLKADATLADGSSVSSSTDITVGAAPAGSFITLRADHSVRPGTDTSVRAWPVLAGADTVSSIAWTQLDGPAVSMDSSDNRLLMFKAPAALADAVLHFRATMTTSSGRVDHDDVTVSVERQAAAPTGYLFDITERVHPYRQASVYAGVLARCVYDVSIYYSDSTHNNFCPVATLPLLQSEAGVGAVPSVAQVMGRVLVTHDFLGANFEQFLLTQDVNGDFRRLLAAASAIVIGAHVRPSYYQSATGAVYIDAANLWLTAAQRDVVTEVPDYRIAYAAVFNFSDFGRAVKNNAYARRSFPATERVTRTNEDLILEIGRLLYHELGHASDFFSPSDRTLDAAQSIWLNAGQRISGLTLPSDALAQQYPLRSVEWKGLGQVLYEGATATATQRAYTATQVGAFFAADRASDDYAYAIYQTNNSREDLAMLFEEFMMAYRHGVQYDTAFTDLYTSGMGSGQVIVRWGERGRIAEAAIKPRIKLVLARIAPWIDPAEVDKLPAPILMRVGQSWDANLAISPVASASLKQAIRLEGSADDGVTRARADLKPLRSGRQP